MRLRWPIGGGVCLREPKKKTSKLGKGEVLPLDRSLLMGDFFFLIVLAWRIINHVPYFRKTRRLKAVLSPYRFKTSLNDKTNRAFGFEQRCKRQFFVHC